MAVGLLLIRVVVGVTVSLHGVQKLTTHIQGHGFSGAKQMSGGLGLRPATGFAALAASSELLGGLLVALGLVMPFGCMAVIGMMLTAVILVHGRNGYFVVHGGFEYPFVLGVTTAGLSLLGAGRYSLDSVIGWHLAGWTWFAVALGGGAFASLLTYLDKLAFSPKKADEPATA